MEDGLKQLLEALQPLIGNLGGVKWFGYVLMAMGAMRFFLKPALAFAYSIVEFTETKKDNEMLERLQKSVVFKVVVFILDWFGSIKLPPKKE